jgi:RimJ/RimL family protein N-acetyltransferase
MSYGPFVDRADMERTASAWIGSADPLFFTFDVEGAARGWGAYLRIEPGHGVAEVGHLVFSPRLQRTPAATEAMYLMMRHVFELGYRRYEWKCDALNAASRRAAERLGFTYEGTFRQHMVYKGRNRDTAWYSVIDAEWPKLRDAFEGWLDPSNFDSQGRQRRRLADFR